MLVRATLLDVFFERILGNENVKFVLLAGAMTWTFVIAVILCMEYRLHWESWGSFSNTLWSGVGIGMALALVVTAALVVMVAVINSVRYRHCWYEFAGDLTREWNRRR